MDRGSKDLEIIMDLARDTLLMAGAKQLEIDTQTLDKETSKVGVGDSKTVTDTMDLGVKIDPNLIFLVSGVDLEVLGLKLETQLMEF